MTYAGQFAAERCVISVGRDCLAANIARRPVGSHDLGSIDRSTFRRAFWFVTFCGK